MPADMRFDHVVTESELRRFLRYASTLLAASEAATQRADTRLFLLRRAHHWIRSALAGVDRLARDADAVPIDSAEDR
jgi:hypothetical protein